MNFVREMNVVLEAKDHSEIVIGVPVYDECGTECDVYVGITHSDLMRDYTLRIESFTSVMDYSREKEGGCVEFPEHEVMVDENESVFVNVVVNKDDYRIFIKY